MIFWMVPIVLSSVAAVAAGACYLTGLGIFPRELISVYVASLLASELSVATIWLLKGNDQASATQAGMSGMTVLMLLSVGLLAAEWFMGLLTHSEGVVRFSPLFFLVSLALVACDAVRTIRQTPVAAAKVDRETHT